MSSKVRRLLAEPIRLYENLALVVTTRGFTPRSDATSWVENVRRRLRFSGAFSTSIATRCAERSTSAIRRYVSDGVIWSIIPSWPSFADYAISTPIEVCARLGLGCSQVIGQASELEEENKARPKAANESLATMAATTRSRLGCIQVVELAAAGRSVCELVELKLSAIYPTTLKAEGVQNR